MNTILVIIILIIIVMVLCYFGYYVMTKIVDKESGEYTIILPHNGPANNMNDCLRGCQRGGCLNKSDKSGEKHCKFDFQCQYCRDKDTNMFYTNGNYDNESNIVPEYEDAEQNEIESLNKMIKKNNLYIKDMNEIIMNDSLTDKNSR
jgi:glutaredoxin